MRLAEQQELMVMAKVVAEVLRQLNEIRGGIRHLRNDIRTSEQRLKKEMQEGQEALESRIVTVEENGRKVMGRIDEFEARITELEEKLEKNGELCEDEIDELQEMIDAVLPTDNPGQED